jgi:rhodanese-related sulfurtransferase
MKGTAAMAKPCAKPEPGEAIREIELLDPAEVAARRASGAVLVDVRGESTRRGSGIIEGAVPVDKANIDRDFSFASEERLPEIMGPDQQLIVYCSSERGSGPVAARLRELGFINVAHLRGGFPAWQAAGLPVAPAQSAAITQ